jgi:hypothetical protein
MNYACWERTLMELRPSALNAALIAEHMLAAGWPASWPPGPVDTLAAEPNTAKGGQE